MWFIDLPIASDSVDRELRWEVLARFGLPTKVLAVSCQFHKGIRARVRG